MKRDVLYGVLKKHFFIKDLEKAPISKIGEGAWHDVYKIERTGEEDLVLRIKKKTAYGEQQDFNQLELMTEYESSKAYYKQANQCSFKICPTYFDYYLEDKRVFTVESYMGKGVKLETLRPSVAFTYGEELGIFFKVMHRKTPDMKGTGSLFWNGTHLEGREQQKTDQAWKKDNDFYKSILEKMSAAQFDFQTPKVFDRISHLIENRRKNPQKIALVNQDITPENIIFNNNRVFIIDPYPKLDFDLKYAGYFVFCYKFLLPAYSSAPRYKHHSYDKKHHILIQIADGFISGYIGTGDEHSAKRLMEEYILWTLLEAFEHYEVLSENEVSNKILQQMGDKETIYVRLKLCFKELESQCLVN
jgi:hypothetical protein